MIVSLLLSVREYRRYLKSYRAVGAIQQQLSGFHSEKDSELSDTDWRNKRGEDMRNIIEIADAADMIVNGYAFTKDGENIRVLNLNNPKKAAYLNKNGDVLETSMDDIELDIVSEYYQKNRECMEDDLDE